MIIYVIERYWQGNTVQLGFSPSKKVAEKECKEYNIYDEDCWVREYQVDKDSYCEFECD